MVPVGVGTIRGILLSDLFLRHLVLSAIDIGKHRIKVAARCETIVSPHQHPPIK